jgi:hypothetical protein
VRAYAVEQQQERFGHMERREGRVD